MVSHEHITPFEDHPDLRHGKSQHFADDRGLFSTLRPLMQVQHLNLSKSNTMVVRGLHYQWSGPQGKLVWCIGGYGIDVALDLRFGSETYGKLYAKDISMGEYVFVPKGFAHGLISMNKLEVLYAVDAPYNKIYDTGVNIDSIPELKRFSHFKRSERDKNLPDFLYGHTYVGSK